MEEAIRVMNEVMAKSVTPADREWFAFLAFGVLAIMVVSFVLPIWKGGNKKGET